MMLKSTEKAILSAVNTVLIMATDLNEEEKSDLLKRIRNAVHGKSTPEDYAPEVTVRRPIRRAEAAAMLGLTKESLDRYARLGYLVRVKFGGSSRSSGFTAESVEAFLKGRSNDAALG